MSADTLSTAPITVRLATQINRKLHRHEPGLTGALWAIGLLQRALVVGCAVVGRPKSRALDSAKGEPKTRLEVVRVAVPAGVIVGGHGGAASKLYGAVARAARAMGCLDLFTYTRADESGVTLRAAGWVREVDAEGEPVVFGGGSGRARLDPGQSTRALPSDTAGGRRGPCTSRRGRPE